MRFKVPNSAWLSVKGHGNNYSVFARLPVNAPRLSVSAGRSDGSRETPRLLAFSSGVKSREVSERKWGEEQVAWWSTKRAFD